MRHRLVLSSSVLLSLALLCGCGSDLSSKTSAASPTLNEAKPKAPAAIQSDAPEVIVKPTAPLTLKAPPAPAKILGKEDLSTWQLDDLAGAAREQAGEGQYAAAALLQHWYVLKSNNGRYDLACYLARTGQKDAAFYFLQQAALSDGADGAWAQQDSDLESLRGDPRWRAVSQFLSEANRYWRRSGLLKTKLILPAGYDKSVALPVVIGLHGLSADPENFLSGGAMQQVADELQVALVAVSGTYPRGENSFAWSENPQLDAAHVLKALDTLKDQVKMRRDTMALYGFSQGGHMALELAARDPQHFRGGLALSPGTMAKLDVSVVAAAAEHKNQAFIFACGAGENPDTLKDCRAGHAWARRVGARTELIIYDGMNTHSFPPDFGDRIGPWLRMLLNLPETKNSLSFKEQKQQSPTKLIHKLRAVEEDETPVVALPGTQLIEYPSGALKLKGLLALPKGASKDKQVPAVVYFHGGFALGEGDFADAEPFLKAGFALMLPSLRGENDNPGSFECCFGEVDDGIAAVTWLAQRPEIDAKHIYTFGHSAGGVIAALGALYPDNPARMSGSAGGLYGSALFSYVNLPFDPQNRTEVRLRLFPLNARLVIRKHLAYCGEEDFPVRWASQLALAEAAAGKAPLTVKLLKGNHFTSLKPAVSEYLQEIKSDLSAR